MSHKKTKLEYDNDDRWEFEYQIQIQKNQDKFLEEHKTYEATGFEEGQRKTNL